MQHEFVGSTNIIINALILNYRCLQPTPDSERERHARKKKNTKSGFSILG